MLRLFYYLCGVAAFVACVEEAALRLLNASRAAHSRCLVPLLRQRSEPGRVSLTDVFLLPRHWASQRAHGANRLEHVVG